MFAQPVDEVLKDAKHVLVRAAMTLLVPFALACGQRAAPADADTAPVCVDVDISTYDTSCTRASDCILIATGEICSNGCACPGSPVSASEQVRYDEAVAGIRPAMPTAPPTFCSCFDEVAPSCVEGKCSEL
jgi:hypothetical protein